MARKEKRPPSRGRPTWRAWTSPHGMSFGPRRKVEQSRCQSEGSSATYGIFNGLGAQRRGAHAKTLTAVSECARRAHPGSTERIVSRMEYFGFQLVAFSQADPSTAHKNWMWSNSGGGKLARR